MMSKLRNVESLALHLARWNRVDGQATRLSSNTTTLADEYSRRGQDWESQLQQRAKEVAMMRDLGLSSDDQLA